MRKLAAMAGSSGLIGIILLCSSVPAGAEPAGSRALPAIERTFPNESYAQYRHRPRYYHHHHHHHYHHRPRRYYRDDGAGLALGAAGLAAGVLIGSAIASQAQAAPPPRPPGTVDPSVAAYCARKYRSYDPATGTFLSTNGMRYVCTYP